MSETESIAIIATVPLPENGSTSHIGAIAEYEKGGAK